MKRFKWFVFGWFWLIAVGGLAKGPINQSPLVAIDVVVEPGKSNRQIQGQVVIELDPKHAPITCRNFLNYVEDHFYDGTIFHRLIPGFMIQGGGFEMGMKEKETKESIPNEAANGLENLRGTIAMARTMEVDSATSQFFINYVDNHFLDHRDDGDQGYGYAVFGHVVAGMDFLDKLAKMPREQVGNYADVPVRQLIIKRAKVISQEEWQATQAVSALKRPDPGNSRNTHDKNNNAKRQAES